MNKYSIFQGGITESFEVPAAFNRKHYGCIAFHPNDPDMVYFFGGNSGNQKGFSLNMDTHSFTELNVDLVSRTQQLSCQSFITKDGKPVS